MKKAFLLLVVAVLAITRTQAQQIKTHLVEYKEGTTTLEGFLAFDPATKGKRPAVIVVHEWTGINDYTRKRCEQLAKMGYVAFAADIYGKGVRPSDPQKAGAEAGKYKQDVQLLRRRITAALNQIKKNPNVDAAKVAAIGYCFGGATVLELARSGADVAGVVSFHGNLGTPNPADAANIKTKVLVCHGADDPFVPNAEVETFLQAMNAADVNYQFNIYSNAVHSFTNPEAGTDNSKGAAYNATADRRSWEAMKMFFDEIFSKAKKG